MTGQSSTSPATGFLRPDGDRRAVRFARRYEASPEAVWAALTDPAELGEWLAEAVLEPREGGQARFTFGDEGSAKGRVLAFEPPRLLEYEWHFTGEEESVVRWELSPDGDGGTLLVLDHRRLGPSNAAGYGAGWQAHLDALADRLGGSPHGRPSWGERFAAYLPAYQS